MKKISIRLEDYYTNIGVETYARLKRGWLLTEIRDNKLYEGIADTFTEFLSQRDVRSDARECMKLYDFFICECGLMDEDIQDIHYIRLLEIAKVAQMDNIQDWLNDCRVLSWKDLINKVRGVRKKPPMSTETEKTNSLDLVDSPISCIICGTIPVEKAHYPITEKMGGIITIPLCHYHHIEDLHRHGIKTFTKKYKKELTKYFKWR